DGNVAVAEASRLTSCFSYKDPILGISQVVNHDGRLGLAGAERPSRLPHNAFQIDCSTLIESHSAYRSTPDVMEDLVNVLRGISSNEIDERRATGDKNTFAIGPEEEEADEDRKSTRLNSSHEWISYAVFFLKKKKKCCSIEEGEQPFTTLKYRNIM